MYVCMYECMYDVCAFNHNKHINSNDKNNIDNNYNDNNNNNNIHFHTLLTCSYPELLRNCFTKKLLPAVNTILMLH